MPSRQLQQRTTRGKDTNAPKKNAHGKKFLSASPALFSLMSVQQTGKRVQHTTDSQAVDVATIDAIVAMTRHTPAVG